MPKQPEPPASQRPDLDPVDRGLAEAFGEASVESPGAAGGSRPAVSVLQALQKRAGSILGLHLESPGPDDAPVRVTDEVVTLPQPRCQTKERPIVWGVRGRLRDSRSLTRSALSVCDRVTRQ